METSGKNPNDTRRHGLRGAAKDIRREANKRADTGMNATAQRMQHMSRALKAAEDSLEEQGEERLADLARQASDQLERGAGYLNDERPERLASDLRESARDHPAMFLGGMLAAGIAAGRFLGAQEPQRLERREHQQTLPRQSSEEAAA